MNSLPRHTTYSRQIPRQYMSPNQLMTLMKKGVSSRTLTNSCANGPRDCCDAS